MPRSFSAFAIPTVALMPSARIASNDRDQVGGSSRRLPPTELGNFEVFHVTAELHPMRLGARAVLWQLSVGMDSRWGSRPGSIYSPS
jgi:hypothetical protein